MYKLITTSNLDDNHFSLSLENESDFNKVANERDFPAEVDEAIKNLNRKKNHAYVLVTAMGDGETWGSNKNADYFPKDGLLGLQNQNVHGYDPGKDERLKSEMNPKARYKTFEDGHFFHHHNNKIEKDPHFGYIPNAIWYPKMRTILLLIGIDRDKDPETSAMIDRNELISVSMGSKVPYDVCSICGNKAKNIFQYCPHVKFERNMIRPDGRKAFMYNYHPRFFDISKVTKPAFLAGMQLEKVATTMYGDAFSVDLADEYNLAFFDKEATHKMADIKKEIPAHVEGAIHRLANTEKDLPKQLLDHLATLKPQEAWGALAYKNIIAKPNEFAYIILKHGGNDEKASHFLNAKVNLSSADPTNLEVGMTNFAQINFNHKAKTLANSIPNHVVEDRSITETLVRSRLYEADKGIRKEATVDKVIGLGSILSALYMIYRQNVNGVIDPMGLIGGGIALTALDKPDSDKYIGNNYNITEELNKKAGVKSNVLKAAGGFAAPYILSAHLQQKKMNGEPVGPFGNFVSNHPGTLGIIGAGIALKPGTALNTAKDIGKGLMSGFNAMRSK